MNILRTLLVVTALAFVVHVAWAADGKAITFDMGAQKVTVAPPEGWQVNDGPPVVFFDFSGQKGSISFTGSPMAGTPEETFAIMRKAALDQGNARVKAGELIKCELKAVDKFEGVLTVESGKDPSIRRMQWVGYGRGGFYTIMMASSGEAFDGYLPLFTGFLDKIRLAGK